jgi:hypothetical protein
MTGLFGRILRPRASPVFSPPRQEKIKTEPSPSETAPPLPIMGLLGRPIPGQLGMLEQMVRSENSPQPAQKSIERESKMRVEFSASPPGMVGRRSLTLSFGADRRGGDTRHDAPACDGGRAASATFRRKIRVMFMGSMRGVPPRASKASRRPSGAPSPLRLRATIRREAHSPIPAPAPSHQRSTRPRGGEKCWLEQQVFLSWPLPFGSVFPGSG